MSFSSVNYTLWKILQGCSFLLFFPIIVGIIYGEGLSVVLAFFTVAVGLLAVSTLFSLKRPQKMRIRTIEGHVITFFVWLIFSIVGALPFVIYGSLPTFFDAFFEAVSGFTTTGSTVIPNVEIMPHSILFWRSFMHLIGGMGVLVLALAVLPNTDANTINIMKSEMTGPTFSKASSRIRDVAMSLYAIYLTMTALLTLLLILGGMPVFDSVIHAFGAAGTGGFSCKNQSIGYYNSSYITNVLTVGMLLFGVNFNVYYLLLKGKIKKAVKNEEMRWYFIIAIVTSLVVFVNVLPKFDSWQKAIEDSFFTVSSIMTTTGYVTADFDLWPVFSKVMLVLMMLIGASAGSTGGGFKVSRTAVVIKTFIKRLHLERNPHVIKEVQMDKEVVPYNVMRGILHYLCVYVVTFITFLILVSLDCPDFETALSAVSATFNNIGPGLAIVGPTSTFAGFSHFSKVVLSFSMLAGRLEIIPFIVAASPRTWRFNS